MSRHVKQLGATSARLASIHLLSDLLLNKTSLAQSGLYFSSLSPQDKGFSQALIYGTCRHYFELDTYLASRLHKKLKPKDYDILAVLLLGIYQLLYMRTPEHAAINSSVDLCRALKKQWACKLVNAILRNVQRTHADEKKWLAERESFENWQLHSHPEWLYNKIAGNWPDHIEQIMKANNTQASMCLRLKPSQDINTYQAQLSSQDIDSQACAISSQGLRLIAAQNFDALPGSQEGLVSVQDEAAQLAALLLDPQDDEYILDACAAPGGKTCHILELSNAHVLALDIDAQRCEKIEENLERLNLRASIQVADAIDTNNWWDQKSFDRILLDAPCSATGVIRRHPDIKLLRRETDIAQLTTIQAQLLEALWPLLKPGGRLVYATCSILKQENERQIAAFIKKQSDVKTVTINLNWDDTFCFQQKHGIQILPSDNGPDGFYYAVLEKNKLS